MSARPSLSVCAALLAALLAPPASAKPAEPARGSAQRGATASRPAAKATAPAEAKDAGRPDMAKKSGASAAATSARVPRPDVIDGRDKAAVRELYRKRKPAEAPRAAEGTRRPRTEATRAPTDASARADARAEARREIQEPAIAAAEPRTKTQGPATPAVVTREAAPAPAQPTRAEEPAVVQASAPSDMVKKTGSKKQGRKASEDEDEVVAVAAGPKPAASSGCAAGLSATPAQQFDRTRETLREFSWADMAYFFETADDEAEPEPRQVAREGTLPADEAIRRSGLPRKTLASLADARAVDLLTERELVRIDKALTGASPAAIATLLQADSPSLRAHVWTWLATTPTGVCTLVKLDGREVEAAIRDRSVAVEHGEDLVFRPLGAYALAARTRLAAADPPSFDALLRTLWTEPGIDPRVRALIAGLRVRRGHADSIEAGLRDPAASIRGATAAAAIERDRARYESRMLDHAADDPADLVTELIVGELLGGAEGVPRGELAERRDERVMAAVSRWRGRGDPLSPLPVPAQPLRFSAPKKIEAAPAPAPAPVVAAAPAPAPEPEPAREPTRAPAMEAREEVPARSLAHAPTRREAEAPAGPRLPSVLDDPDAAALRP